MELKTNITQEALMNLTKFMELTTYAIRMKKCESSIEQNGTSVTFNIVLDVPETGMYPNDRIGRELINKLLDALHIFPQKNK